MSEAEAMSEGKAGAAERPEAGTPDGRERRLGPPMAGASRLAIEGAMIVFSILLGFALNEWREDRSREALAATAIERFRAEIEHNRESVEERLAYHREVAANVAAELAAEAPVDEPLLAVMGRIAPRGIGPPDARDTAWETALASRALEEIDYDLLFVIATVYRAQESGVMTTWPQILGESMRPESFDPDRRRALLLYLGLAFGELVAQEAALLDLYDWSLDVLDGKRDPVEARDALQ